MNKDNNKPEISVILPMYNEAENIYADLVSVLKVLKEMDVTWELFAIDDGSIDDTREQAEKALMEEPNACVISYSPNRGRGFALRKGFSHAQGKYIITTESDLSWGEGIIRKIFDSLVSNDIDAVIVSPYIQKNGLINVPLKRRFLSRIGNKILTFGLPVKLTMVTGMTRGYKKEIIESMILQMDGKEIHLEIISNLLAIGAKIKEIPGVISWKKRRKQGERKQNFEAKRLILSHLYFSFVESPLHFVGLLGLMFFILGCIGIATIVFFKVIGFSLLNIPYFPVYSFVCLIVGLLVMVFSLLSSQIRNLHRELIRIYAEISKKKK